MHQRKESLFLNRNLGKRRFFARVWGKSPIFARFQAVVAVWRNSARHIHIIRLIFPV
jgi:hypothetical protein